jgi:phosphoenolpyruvate phosphomutase
MKKAKNLRELFRDQKLIKVVGAHNGLTARLVERHGFDAVWASGFEVSTSHAVPDANILTMSDYVRVAVNMNEAVNIPVIIDADTGYGNSNNVIYLVKKLESADIAAMCIEDKLFPKVNSYIPGRQELAPISEFVGKIMAAKNAQKSKDFMVFARVEALIAGWGQEEAIKRAHAYVDAGADAILIHSKASSSKEIEEFVGMWGNRAPLISVPTAYPMITEDDIAAMDIKMVIYANAGIRASIQAVNDTFTELKNKGTLSAVTDKISPMNLVFDLQDMPRLKEFEKKYLKTGDEKISAIIPASGDNSTQASLKYLLQDIPLTMLDINGKPLIERSLEILNSLGIQDITVVGGYKADKINIDGINLVVNKKYDRTHIMYSLMQAEKKLKDKLLILFSDILFERDILEKLIHMEEDIVLVIDRSHKENSFPQDKKLDLVVAEFEANKGPRVIKPERKNKIMKIGKNISPDEANHEFVGISMFSKNGAKILKKEYKALSKQKTNNFHEADSFEMLSFTDMIQILVDKGYPVYSLEIYKGWTEIRSFDEYKNACRMLAENKKL